MVITVHLSLSVLQYFVPALTIGSTANVYIVTVSEKLAKTTGNPDLAITPLKWAKKGLPVMILTLVICTIIMYLFFDYYSLPLHP